MYTAITESVPSEPSMGFPREKLERSHKKKNKLDCPSDLSFERSHGESLDYSPGWLRLDLDLLTKRHPHSCLGGWLDASLDPAQSWDREDASLLDLCRCKGRQALEEA